MQLLEVLPLGIRPASVQLYENIQGICNFADFYIRGRQRQQFLHDCTDKNLKLCVIGRQSNRYKDTFPSHQYEEAMPFEQLLQRISMARCVAHNSPGFQRGLHERVTYPLALGSLVICNLPFVKNQFQHAIQAIQAIQFPPRLDVNSY